MAATLFASERPSVLDTSCGDLVLRISSPLRKGQIVRLRSTKCTIGSGPHCTLRLRARGVAPIHCLLLRGRTRTIARCWSADTRLNHRQFTDAIVASGDKLSVGPIELEVLDLGMTPPERGIEIEREEVQHVTDERHERLAAQMAKLDAERDALAKERDGLEAQRNSLEEERRRWTAEQTRTLQDIDDQCRQLSARLDHFDAERIALASQRSGLEMQQSALEKERRQWHAEQEATSRDATKHNEQLAARLAELELERNALASQLDAERNALAAERSGLEAQRAALEEECRLWQTSQEVAVHDDEHGKELTARIAELDAERNALAVERSGLEAQRAALEEERRLWQASQEAAAHDDEHGKELTARIAELDAERNALAFERIDLKSQQNALAEERQRWQTERETSTHGESERIEQLTTRLATIESERDALTEERRQWQTERETITRDETAHSEQLAARLAELEAERNALASERSGLEADRNALAEERRQWETERETIAPVNAEASEELTPRFAELEAERNALAEERRQWQAERETTARENAECGEQLATRLAEIRAEQNTLALDRSGLDVQRNALAEERQKWQAERDQALWELDEQRKRLSAELSELEEERQALAEKSTQRDVEEAETLPPQNAAAEPAVVEETPELQFEEPAERPPVDLNEIFRRVGAKVDLSEDEPAEPVAEKATTRGMPLRPAAAESATTRVTAASATPSEEGHEEESIDDYMQKLMQRVRATTGEPEPSARPMPRVEPTRGGPETSASMTAEERLESESARSSTGAEPKPAEPLRTRSALPPKPINMDALREVANLSAKSAIGQHARRTMVRTMYGKLLLTGVALTVGVGLFWLWKQYGASEITLYSSAVAIVVALMFGLQYATLIGRMIVAKAARVHDRQAAAHRADATAASPDGDDNR